MNVIAHKAYTAEEQAELRQRVRDIMEAEGLKQSHVARDAGIAYGTFTGWFAGTYQGNNDRVAAEVERWLQSRAEKQKAAAAIPQAPGFQATPTAKIILQNLQFAQLMPDIVVVAGGAGIGKTTAVRHYAASNPNVWVATMEPCSGTVYPMLGEIAEVMGLTEKVQTRLSRAIGAKVRGTGGLIVIDEAQHLDSRSLDQLRSLYDRYGVGIALVGNETVYSRLEGEGRKANFAQLFSRIGMRLTQARPRTGDVCDLIRAWGVQDQEAIKLLKWIARKPGALRGMTKVLQVATMLAAGAGEALGVEHVRRAWDQLSTTPQEG